MAKSRTMTQILFIRSLSDLPIPATDCRQAVPK
jgi:hypothetical protein